MQTVQKDSQIVIQNVSTMGRVLFRWYGARHEWSIEISSKTTRFFCAASCVGVMGLTVKSRGSGLLVSALWVIGCLAGASGQLSGYTWASETPVMAPFVSSTFFIPD